MPEHDQPMPESDLTFTALDRDSTERFGSLRRALGVTGFGINQMVLAPGQGGRIHSHEHQEEVYLVLEGRLTLVVEGRDHILGKDELARVGPALRRQLVNAGPERVILLALGGSGDHVGRDAHAWSSWEDDGPGIAPQEIPLPADLPIAAPD